MTTTEKPPHELFVLHGERATILAAALESGKKIVPIQDTIEGRTVIRFFMEEAE